MGIELKRGEFYGTEVTGTSPVSWCSSFLQLERTKPPAVHYERPEFVHLGLLRVSVSFPGNKTLMEPPGVQDSSRDWPGAVGKQGRCGTGTSAELRAAAAFLDSARPWHLPCTSN